MSELSIGNDSRQNRRGNKISKKRARPPQFAKPIYTRGIPNALFSVGHSFFPTPRSPASSTLTLEVAGAGPGAARHSAPHQASWSGVGRRGMPKLQGEIPSGSVGGARRAAAIFNGDRNKTGRTDHDNGLWQYQPCYQGGLLCPSCGSGRLCRDADPGRLFLARLLPWPRERAKKL